MLLCLAGRSRSWGCGLHWCLFGKPRGFGAAWAGPALGDSGEQRILIIAHVLLRVECKQFSVLSASHTRISMSSTYSEVDLFWSDPDSRHFPAAPTHMSGLGRLCLEVPVTRTDVSVVWAFLQCCAVPSEPTSGPVLM